MPYEWLPASSPDEQHLHLWPFRSLPRRGMVWFIGGTAAMLLIPLAAVIGSPVLWGLLPFLLVVLGGIWFALEKSYRDAEIVEDLTLTRADVRLVRHGPKGQRQEWQANRHWVRIVAHPTGGPVPHYLTLRGGPREVEIGAFLTEEERKALSDELSQRLRAA
jgi:uncharacterized membrane protein